MTRFLLLSDSCECVDVGRSLWREDGSVVYNCCWPSAAQLFSGPSLLELATIFYCLRFETSLFVASYDSRGYGGGIRPRLHTGLNYDLNFVALIIPRHGPTENTTLLLLRVCWGFHVIVNEPVHWCTGCCLATAVVSLFVSRFLPNSWSVRRNIKRRLVFMLLLLYSVGFVNLSESPPSTYRGVYKFVTTSSHQMCNVCALMDASCTW
jgi:hypothetical protein